MGIEEPKIVPPERNAQDRESAAEKTKIGLAKEAEEAFAQNDLETAMRKLQQLEAAAMPERAGPESAAEKKYLEKLNVEFEWQIAYFRQKHYKEALGSAADALPDYLQALREKLPEIAKMRKEIPEEHLPFLIVPKDEFVPLEKKITLMKFEGEPGIDYTGSVELKNIPAVDIPESSAYLLVDVESGMEYLNFSGDKAAEQLIAEDRSPLTAEEGVMLVTLHPEAIRDHWIDLPGSRDPSHAVPTIRIDKGRPSLGIRAPRVAHPDCGAASCAKRVGLKKSDFR